MTSISLLLSLRLRLELLLLLLLLASLCPADAADTDDADTRAWHQLSGAEQTERKRAFVERELGAATAQLDTALAADQDEQDALAALEWARRQAIQ